MAAALLIIPLGLATLLALLADLWWLFELFVHFTVQYAALFGLALVIAALARARPLVVLAAAGLAINLARIALSLASPPSSATDAASLDVRIVTYNVFLGRQDDPVVTEFFAASDADIIVLQEFPVEGIPALLARLPGYPYWTAEGAAMTQGAVILSRWPIISSAAIPLSDQPTHVTRAEIGADGHHFTLYGAHLQWPLVPRLARLRDSEADTLGRVLSMCAGACLVIGDFNMTPWSPGFRGLLASGGLADCAGDQPLLSSWPTFFAPARIRIDHCLVNKEWEVRDARQGPRLPSDHFPMVYDLRLRAPASRAVAPAASRSGGEQSLAPLQQAP